MYIYIIFLIIFLSGFLLILFLVIKRITINEDINKLIIINLTVSRDSHLLEEIIDLRRGEVVTKGGEGLAELSLMNLAGTVLVAGLEAVDHIVMELVGGGEGGVLAADGLEVVKGDELVLDLFHDGLCLLAVGCLAKSAEEVRDLFTDDLSIAISVKNGEDVFDKFDSYGHFLLIIYGLFYKEILVWMLN